MQSGNQADSINNIYNNRIADLQAQLSDLVIQNESLDSLIDVTQFAIAADFVLDSNTQIQNYAVESASSIVADTLMVTDTLLVTDTAVRDAIKANVVTDTADLVLVDPVPLKDSLIMNGASDTGEIQNTLPAVTHKEEISQSQPKDSLRSNTTSSQSSMDLLAGNIVVTPVVNKDTITQNTASIQKDTATLQANISATEDSLSGKTVINKAANNAAAPTQDIATRQQRDSLNNKSGISQSSDALLTGNTVVVPVVGKTGKDSIPANGDNDIAILQARVRALEDSLNSKTVVSSNSKEVSERDTAVVPSVNKTVQDTVSLNKPAAKEDVVLLRERIRTLEDSLSNNAITGKTKNNVLTATRTDPVAQQPADTLPYKAYAGKASSQQPTAEGEEVTRLRSELASLQKEKESLMQQLDETPKTIVSSPANTGRAAGNDNAATQEDINSLKSEIQSLKGTIKENNRQVTAPNRSLLPPIVPAIGIGVGKTKVERVVQHDTIFVERPADTASHIDTVRVTDTIMVRDTVRISDTVKQILRDTVQQTVVKDNVITVVDTAGKQKESLLALPPFIILFDLGKSDVKLVYRKRLDYYAAQLMQYKDLKIVITGHTDKTGSVANNLILSEKRAKSISGYLIGKGVSSDAMQLDNLGEAAPITENNTKEGQSQNRRVELIFKEK